MLFAFLLACANKTENLSEPVVKPSTEPNTESEIIILSEGDWSLSTPNLVSDVCGVGDFQDVTGFVPPSVGIGNSTKDGYLMLPDGLTCTRNNMDFSCASLYLEEDTGIGATLSITNEIGGFVIDEETMILDFDVTIDSCEGLGCYLIEVALTWPCLIELQTEGIYNP